MSMEPGDYCGYCRYRETPGNLSDTELNSYTVDGKHPNPSAITTPNAKRTCMVACTKLKIVLHNNRYHEDNCPAFVNKDESSDGGGPSNQKSGSCWVASAYYGDPLHPDVTRLRLVRRKYLENPKTCSVMTTINLLYQFIGNSRVGGYWANKVRNNNRGIFRWFSGIVCKATLRFFS